VSSNVPAPEATRDEAVLPGRVQEERLSLEASASRGQLLKGHHALPGRDGVATRLAAAPSCR
jgi:hypothetical protein